MSTASQVRICSQLPTFFCSTAPRVRSVSLNSLACRWYCQLLTFVHVAAGALHPGTGMNTGMDTRGMNTGSGMNTAPVAETQDNIRDRRSHSSSSTKVLPLRHKVYDMAMQLAAPHALLSTCFIICAHQLVLTAASLLPRRTRP
jgi:hypothetical protein